MTAIRLTACFFGSLLILFRDELKLANEELERKEAHIEDLEAKVASTG